MRIYIIDTSSLIEMKDKYPIDIFPTIWEKMEELYKNNRLIAPLEVKKEIRDDELKNWIRNKKDMFISPDDIQLEKVKDILDKFPSLVKSEKPQPEEADPWLIALAIRKKEEAGIFSKDYIIVTEESRRKPKKLPAVANHYGIECINLIELFRKEGWRF